MACGYDRYWFGSPALFSLPARALYLDSTIFDMAADKSFISKRVFNDSHKQNIYSISAVKIDKPGLAGSVAGLSKRRITVCTA